jgi:hypothetical protein
MKRQLSILLLAVSTTFFTACQKKQVAYFQKTQTETFAHSPKSTQPVDINEEVTTTVSNPLADEVVVTSSNEPMAMVPVVKEIPKKLELPVLQMNEKSIEAELEKLNRLEEYVKIKNVTADEVKGTELTKELKLDNQTTTAFLGETPANIPAFWWGCVLSWIGILVVYFTTDKDQDQTKKAFYGCLVSAGASVLVYVIFLLIAFGSLSRGL